MTPAVPAWARPGLRAVRHRRGLLAAGLTAAAVATALPQLAPPVEPGVPVLAAARDLPAGAVLDGADVVRVRLPRDVLPTGALTDEALDGLRLAGPVRRGEALTDARVVGPGLLAPGGDLVAAPVRIADAAAAALLRAGDRVDVLAASPDGLQTAAPVAAAGVLVLAVPTAQAQGEGGLVLLATTPATAARLAAASVSSRLSVVLRAA